MKSHIIFHLNPHESLMMLTLLLLHVFKWGVKRTLTDDMNNEAKISVQAG